MVWVKPDLLPTTYYNFILAKNMNYTGWALSTATTLTCRLSRRSNYDQDVAQVATSVWPIEPGRWVHLAGRLSGGLVTVWMNGVSRPGRTSRSGRRPQSHRALRRLEPVRRRYLLEGEHRPDRIYDRALSAVEIRAAMWDAGTPSTAGSPSGGWTRLPGNDEHGQQRQQSHPVSGNRVWLRRRHEPSLVALGSALLQRRRGMG